MLVDIIDRTAEAIRQWGIEAVLTAVVVAKLAVPTLAGVLPAHGVPGHAMPLHHRTAVHRVIVVSSRSVEVQARHVLR